MADIIGIGAIVFDTLVQLDSYPKEDTKIQSCATKTQCGGPCATAMIAASRLGAKAAYSGTVGNDLYGEFMINSLQKNGVDCSGVQVARSAQSFHSTVLLVPRNASRTCVWNKGNVPDLRPEQVNLEALRMAKYLHLDGHQYGAAVYAAQKAHEFGTKVSLDAGNANENVRSLLPLTDILIGSEEFSTGITGAETPEEAIWILWEEYHPEVLIITCGKEGGIYIDNGESRHYPAYPVEAVDTNGAGDTFHGAFLAAKCSGKSDFDAICTASAASALKCMSFGTQEGLPNMEKVQKFLKMQDEGIKR